MEVSLSASDHSIGARPAQAPNSGDGGDIFVGVVGAVRLDDELGSCTRSRRNRDGNTSVTRSQSGWCDRYTNRYLSPK